MGKDVPADIARLLALLKGLNCWYVSCGGAAGSTFELVLGQKIRRPRPVKNLCHPAKFRHFGGEASIFVWCAWRLDGLNSALTSSEETDDSVKGGLAALIGARIDSAEAVPPVWDLNIRFSNLRYLRVFCDRVGGDPKYISNWDLSTPTEAIYIGPGTTYKTEVRPSVKYIGP